MDFHEKCNAELTSLDADIDSAHNRVEVLTGRVETNEADIETTTQELGDLKSSKATQDSVSCTGPASRGSSSLW